MLSFDSVGIGICMVEGPSIHNILVFGVGIYVPLHLVRRRAPHSPPGELQICRVTSVHRRLVRPTLGYLPTELLFLPAGCGGVRPHEVVGAAKQVVQSQFLSP